MNCSVHNNRPAVGQCSECGKPLCSECFNFTRRHICLDCIEEMYRHDKKVLTNCLVFGFIFGIIFAAIMGAVLASTQGAAFGAGFGIYFFFGGFSFGMTIFLTKDQHKPAGTILIFAILSLLFGIIFFIIDLIPLIRIGKAVGNEKWELKNYPR